VRYRVLLTIVLMATAVSVFWVAGINLVVGWLGYALGPVTLGTAGVVIFAIIFVVGAALAQSGD